MLIANALIIKSQKVKPQNSQSSVIISQRYYDNFIEVLCKKLTLKLFSDNFSKLELCQYYCIVSPLGVSLLPEERIRWALHKNATCCFEKTFEAAPYKTTAVWLLTSYLTNHWSMMSKICWKSKDVLMWTLIHGHSSFDPLAKIYIHQLSADIGYRLVDLQSSVIDRDGWWERVKGICAWLWHWQLF